MHSTCLLLLQGEAVEEMDEEPESELEPPAPQSERELQVSLHSTHCVLPT